MNGKERATTAGINNRLGKSVDGFLLSLHVYCSLKAGLHYRDTHSQICGYSTVIYALCVCMCGYFFVVSLSVIVIV